MAKEIAISKIRTDGLQMRVQMNEAAIAEYAELMAGGTVFPPVTLFRDAAGTHWLADGFHRLEAARRGGRKTVTADVRRGEWIDALRYALHANSGHGMRMTNADKRHALEVAWRERERLFGGEPSNALLMDVCGVSRMTVARWRNELAGCNNVTPCGAAEDSGQGVTLLHPEGVAEDGDRVSQCDTLGDGAEAGQGVTMLHPDEAGQGITMLHPEGAGAGSPGYHKVTPCENGNGTETAKEPPKMPVRRIGRDGKAYAVPARPKRPARKVPTDRYGVEIPVEINAAFEGGALADLLAAVSKARVALRKAFEDSLPQFAAVRQDALVNLNNAYAFIRAAEPHCVCRMCQGNGCRACHNRGWQTEEEYGRNPKEFKA